MVAALTGKIANYTKVLVPVKGSPKSGGNLFIKKHNNLQFRKIPARNKSVEVI